MVVNRRIVPVNALWIAAKTQLPNVPRPPVNFTPYVPARTVPGLRGIFEDILNAGQDWLQNRLESSGIGGTTDVVVVQNQVSQAMDALSAQYYPIRDSGGATPTLITQYQQQMRSIIDGFCAWCNRIGTSRAFDACHTIQYWGGKWIQDREAEKPGATGGGGQVPVIDPITGAITYHTGPSTIPGFSTIQNYLPMILGGVFLFAVLKGSKRW